MYHLEQKSFTKNHKRGYQIDIATSKDSHESVKVD